MSDSGILLQAINIEKVKKSQASHFALCNANKIRYLISFNKGKERLSDNIATYSGKLGLLMKLLKFTGFFALKSIKLGYYVELSLHPVIKEAINQLNPDEWNMIVGTYDEKQKLVLQCYWEEKSLAIFLKVGNKETEKEMCTEIEFLEARHTYNYFNIPTIISSTKIDKFSPFTMHVTEEIVGVKVRPELTEDIIKIYKELSSKVKLIEDVKYEFSHGDFAPWNIKKNGAQYYVYDWEHCGYRIKGFDLMHYATIIEVIIRGKSISEAYDTGLEVIRKFLPEFNINKNKFLEEFKKLRKQLY